MNADISGFLMHYEIFGDGECPLLWLHGWTGTGADWKFIFKEVPGGFQIIGPDLRGNGASSGFEGTHRFEQSARGVLALLDHLSGGCVLASDCFRLSFGVNNRPPNETPDQDYGHRKQQRWAHVEL